MTNNYHIKELTDYTDLSEYDTTKAINKFKNNVGKHGFTAQCTAQLDCFTLFGNRFEASLSLMYGIRDVDEYFRTDMHANSVSVRFMVGTFIQDVLWKVMDDYFWVYSFGHNLDHPILFKIVRGEKKNDISIRQTNYFSDAVKEVHEEAKKHLFRGCYIHQANLIALPIGQWINKKGDYMTDKEVALVKEKYGELFFEEGATLVLNREKNRFIEQIQKGSFSSYYGIKVSYRVVGSNVEISWENNNTGAIRVYRLEDDGFSYDCTAGSMIGDSNFKKGQVFDYNLSTEKTYYYTVVLHWLQTGFLVESAWNDTPLCRFSIVIPNDKTKDDTPLQDYIKSKEFDLAKKKVDKEFRVSEEMDTLEVDIAKRKRLADARNKFAQEFLDGKEESQLNEDERQMYNELMELIDFQIKRVSLRR